MGKNQLFKLIPGRELCLNVLKCFGLKGFDDTSCFSRKDLEMINCVVNMNKLKPDLMKYYLPCKARTYLNDMTNKNVITILRQIVRLYGYCIISREKYIRGEKFIIYTCLPREHHAYKPILVLSNDDTEEERLTVTFD